MATPIKSTSSLWLSYMRADISDLNVLYTDGKHNRQNIFEKGMPEEIKSQARSVACLVKCKYLVKKDGLYEWQNVKTLKDRLGDSKPFAEDEPFRDELSPGFGTAFLVAKKLVMTASHCVCKRGTYELDEGAISKTRLVFGFYMETAKLAPIKKAWVFKIKNVTAWSKSKEEGDWAFLELKKKPEGLVPLPIDCINIVHDPISIYMLGHPSGLPQKYTVKGKVVEKETKDNTQFEAKIDAFAGNLGSPVFNVHTKQVIGILVRGNKDYDKTGPLTVPHHVSQDEMQKYGFEKCQRITTLPDHVLDKIDPRKTAERQNAVEICLKVEELVQSSKITEAIKLLKPLSDDGVQAANCALAALDSEKSAKYRKKALKSGFFAEERIDDVIRSLKVIGHSDPAILPYATRVVDIHVQMPLPGSSSAAKDILSMKREKYMLPKLASSEGKMYNNYLSLPPPIHLPYLPTQKLDREEHMKSFKVGSNDQAFAGVSDEVPIVMQAQPRPYSISYEEKSCDIRFTELNPEEYKKARDQIEKRYKEIKNYPTNRYADPGLLLDKDGI